MIYGKSKLLHHVGFGFGHSYAGVAKSRKLAVLCTCYGCCFNSHGLCNLNGIDNISRISAGGKTDKKVFFFAVAVGELCVEIFRL